MTRMQTMRGSRGGPGDRHPLENHEWLYVSLVVAPKALVIKLTNKNDKTLDLGPLA